MSFDLTDADRMMIWAMAGGIAASSMNSIEDGKERLEAGKTAFKEALQIFVAVRNDATHDGIIFQRYPDGYVEYMAASDGRHHIIRRKGDPPQRR